MSAFSIEHLAARFISFVVRQIRQDTKIGLHGLEMLRIGV